MQAQTTQAPIPAKNDGHRFIASPPAAIVRLAGRVSTGTSGHGELAAVLRRLRIAVEVSCQGLGFEQ